MKSVFYYIIKVSFVVAFLVITPIAIFARDFVVVIDAGHGGKDCGAVGEYAQEKDITLNVVKLFGEKIKQEYDGVKVVYTRDKDKYLTLQQRAKIANNAKGDLFISVHVNSIDKNSPGRTSVAGASVYTLGLHRSEDNLEVAKRENSVIELEQDYTTSYSGFDPNSPESYIIFEMSQSKHMMQSIEFAGLVQDELINTSNRKDKGVRQAGFWVLWATSMPSVLIELDFICNPTQERFLASDNGQEQLSQSIFNAFQIYYNTYGQVSSVKNGDAADVKSKRIKKTKNNSKKQELSKEEEKLSAENKSENENIKVETSVEKPVIDENEEIYRIQILTSNKLLKDRDREFKGLSPVWKYKEGAIYKYTVEATNSINEAKKLLKDVQKKFPQAFIAKFRNGKRVK